MASTRNEENPFRPDFGRSPAIWSGRSDLIQPFAETMSKDQWSMSRSLVISGIRGSGKTALLNELEDVAKQNGWVLLRTTATADAYQHLVETAIPAAMQKFRGTKTKLSQVSVAHVGSVSFDADEAPLPKPELEYSLRQLETAILDRGGAGVIITVDEAQHFDSDFVHRLATAVQSLNRDDLPVSLIFAGLTDGINQLLSLPGITFLRRARRYQLGSLTVEETRTNFAETAAMTDIRFTPEGLEEITLFSHGYPYLIQLSGWLAWREARDRDTQITPEVVHSVEGTALAELGEQVHALQVRDLTAGQREFLNAMAEHTDIAQIAPIAAIAATLGKSVTDVSAVRAKLIAADVVVSAGRGLLQFTVPYFSEYLRGSAGPSRLFW